MLAKTDSDTTSSLPGSSPPQSPPHRTPTNPVYYVQSPSHDDGEKTTNSFHSTPAALSPMGSPPPDSTSNSNSNSNSNSSTRFSGSSGNKGRRHTAKKWKDDDDERDVRRFDAIEEEESLLGMEEGGAAAVSRRCCYVFAFVVSFLILFTFFSLVLYAASRSQKPLIALQSVRFEEFRVQAGTDGTGVATSMVTMNVTLKLLYRNTATFFGIHVAPTPVSLFYHQIILATATIDRFYERRKSQRNITVHVTGTSVPVYGGGSDLSSKDGAPVLPVGMILDFRVRSRAYVLGRLVKPKFYESINCPVVMDPKKMKVALSLQHNCTYL